MKNVTRVLLIVTAACVILLPASVQVNSPAYYPTIIADGVGPTPPPPPPGNNAILSGTATEVLIADGVGPTPPPPPPGNDFTMPDAGITVL